MGNAFSYKLEVWNGVSLSPLHVLLINPLLIFYLCSFAIYIWLQSLTSDQNCFIESLLRIAFIRNIEAFWLLEMFCYLVGIQTGSIVFYLMLIIPGQNSSNLHMIHSCIIIFSARYCFCLLQNFGFIVFESTETVQKVLSLRVTMNLIILLCIVIEGNKLSWFCVLRCISLATI